MTDRGHLFVVQADLTRLSADAFIIPCDSQVNVGGTWRAFVEPGFTPQPAWMWFKPEGVQLSDHMAILPDCSPATTNLDDAIGVRVLLDTVGAESSVAKLVERLLRAVETAAAHAPEPHAGRELPLIALPLIGVGQGSFQGRRAVVVRALVAALNDFVSGHRVDVALTFTRRADFAAAQWQRHLVQQDGGTLWPNLDEQQRRMADELGSKAARQQLSVFIGAGVSKPLGFPDWKGLLCELARAAGKDFDVDRTGDYPGFGSELAAHFQAQRNHDPDAQSLNQRIAERFQTHQHALGHALLADLGTQATVTTNYDCCFENAAALTHRDPRLEVLVRELASGRRPWLLKLHGDVEHPKTIVLSKEQYHTLNHELNAIRGVVQSLMLTGHLLFVGFGFADSDFLEMAKAVQRVRELAKDSDPADFDAKVGTALSLSPSSAQPYPLRYLSMKRDGESTAAAARRLEIFLDRLAWTCTVTGDGRAAYLLNPAYVVGSSDDDQAVRKALLNLEQVVHQHPDSAGASLVRELLRELGHPGS